MILSRDNIRSHISFIIFYIAFLFLGLSVYNDFGLSWDESFIRYEGGVLNAKYIKTGDIHLLDANASKYHGPAFELFLIAIEKITGFKNMRDIYVMRHLVTFLLFAFSVLLFYLFCFRCFKAKWIALAGAVFLVLSPRIFADAFYNSKDIGFMCMIIVCMYTTLLFLEKKNIRNALFNAIATAILIDIRILGILIPCFTFLVLFFDFLRSPDQRKQILKGTAVYCIVIIGLIILFWPVLWKDPIGNFYHAFVEMSKYPWNGDVLYNGTRISATNLPWHYIPFWVLISTPVLYSVLFIIGVFSLIRKAILTNSVSTMEWLNLYIFFVPLLLIIFLHSVVYDAWRHAFFIYPSFIFIALSGLQIIFTLTRDNKTLINTFKIVVILFCVSIGVEMINLHPYENIYFNFIAGKTLAEAREKFEVDYWGLSYKEGIQSVLKTDTSSHFTLFVAEPQIGIESAKMFSQKDRARILFTDAKELADHYITSYRFNHNLSKFKSEYDVVRDNGIILSVFDLRKNKFTLSGDKNRLFHFIKNNEEGSAQWSDGKVISSRSSYSGEKMESVDSTIEFSSTFSIKITPELIQDSITRKYICISFQARTPAFFEAGLVLQFDSGQAKTYSWQSNPVISSNADSWIHFDIPFLLPQKYSTGDEIKIYFWNHKRNEFYIDDMEVSFYSIPDIEIQKVLLTMP